MVQKQKNKELKTVAIIVAHPDDETLWAGGTMLGQPYWQWYTVCLCRGSDEDRAPKFYEAQKKLGSTGFIGDLDDGPEQRPLDEKLVEQAILALLPTERFDLIISHSPFGEYTKHIRHEEVGKAVIKLWSANKISANELWIFAYEDSNKAYNPKPIKYATIFHTLSKRIWQEKYRIITETYGFTKSGFEAQTTPESEAFWQFTNPQDVERWLNNKRISA